MSAPRVTVAPWPPAQDLAGMVPAWTVPMALRIRALFESRPGRRFIPAPAYVAATLALVQAGVLTVDSSGPVPVYISARLDTPFPGGAL